MDLNAEEFIPQIWYDGEAISRAEVARLNALVNGERPPNIGSRPRRRGGRRRPRDQSTIIRTLIIWWEYFTF